VLFYPVSVNFINSYTRYPILQHMQTREAADWSAATTFNTALLAERYADATLTKYSLVELVKLRGLRVADAVNYSYSLL
jgi:hypothetical protein